MFLGSNCSNLDSEGVVYVGATRSGKTYLAVSDIIRTGGTVFSTIDIRHPNVDCHKFTDIDELMSFDPYCGIIFIDDVAIWLNSQDWTVNKRHIGLRELFVEHGHRHLRIIGTSQKVSQSDIMLRNICHIAIVPEILTIPLMGLFYKDSRRGRLECQQGNVINSQSCGDPFTCGTLIKKLIFDIEDIEFERKLRQIADDDNSKINYAVKYEIWDNEIANSYKSLALAKDNYGVSSTCSKFEEARRESRV